MNGEGQRLDHAAGAERLHPQWDAIGIVLDERGQRLNLFGAIIAAIG